MTRRMMATGVSEESEVTVIDHLTLDISAISENLRLARLVVAGLGTTHGATIDDLENLRIATDEICSHLIANVTSDDRLSLSGVVLCNGPNSAPTVCVHAFVATNEASGVLEDLAEVILEAVTDSYGIDTEHMPATGSWHQVDDEFRLDLGDACDPEAGGGAGRGTEFNDAESNDAVGLNGWFTLGLVDAVSRAQGHC